MLWSAIFLDLLEHPAAGPALLSPLEEPIPDRT